MKRIPVAAALCGLLAAVCPPLAPTALAQALTTPPLPLPSALGKSVVPVVRPPTAANKRHPHTPPHPAPAAALKSTAAKPTVVAKPLGAAKPAAPPAAPPAPAVAPPAPKPDPNKGSVTGLPLPRWVAFRSDEVNLRSGPGIQYPIDWQYHRRNLPVRITREFEAWRLVTDPDGTKGWVHQATLTGRRGFTVKDSERTLRQSASDEAKPVALLKPGVVGYVRNCAAQSGWCELQAGAYRGWLRRADFYGVDPDEAIN